METRTDILYRYPYPIALTYHNAQNAREVMAAHDQRLRLFEVVLKYLASITIAQYVRQEGNDERVNHALQDLSRPSLGQWNGFLREILSYYDRAARRDALFIPEMYEAYFQKSKERPALCRTYNTLRNLVENRTDSALTALSLRQFFDLMITYRNKTVGHGALSQAQCEPLVEPLLDGLEEMLGQLTFVRDHRLVFIEDVRLRRGQYAHEMLSFMGSTPPMRMKNAYLAESPDDYRIEEQLYLCRRDQDVPQLSLHPLMIVSQGDVMFLNESARDRDIEYLSYQTGQVKRPDRLIEDFREIFAAIMVASQETPSPPPPPATPYEHGLRAIENEDWSAAIEWLSQVPSDDPSHADAQARLGQAQQQGEWAGQYHRALQALDAGRWDEALAGLEALQTAAGSTYRDVVQRIAAVRTAQAKSQTLDKLHAQMEEALAARQWDRTLDLLERIDKLGPGFRGVHTLLEKHRRLEELYRQATIDLGLRQWAAALTGLHQLAALEPDYKDLSKLLDRAQTGLDAEAGLAERYSRAQTAMALEDWTTAAALLDEITAENAAYRDAADLLRQTQDKLTVACWLCGSPLPPGRKFCGKCGSSREKPTTVICPTCGQESPFGKKFCGKCGRQLPAR
ncbi:MAG: double zinc ribbon domain-containing protein [Chloroflexota bacterium]